MFQIPHSRKGTSDFKSAASYILDLIVFIDCIQAKWDTTPEKMAHALPCKRLLPQQNPFIFLFKYNSLLPTRYFEYLSMYHG